MKELDEMELREVDGGLFGFDDFLLCIAAGAVLEIISDWDNFERGLSGRPCNK